jgi:hypothetical protein
VLKIDRVRPGGPARTTSGCLRGVSRYETLETLTGSSTFIPFLRWAAGAPDARCHATASLTAFTGRALITFLAGFALNIVGSFVNGLMPFRAFVAGFLITTNFANPGTKKTPVFLSSLYPTSASVDYHFDILARETVRMLISYSLNEFGFRHQLWHAVPPVCESSLARIYDVKACLQRQMRPCS